MKPAITLIVVAGFAAVSAAADAQTQSRLRYYYPVPKADPPQTIDADLCAYGATPAGVMAAIQATRMGRSAVLVEFSRHVGGMTASGLSATDGGRHAKGIAREFYGAVGDRGFPPAAAEKQFRKMLADAGVRVFEEHRLSAVEKQGTVIQRIAMENGNAFTARMFVDATYEGDLLAKAGVTHTVGREANATYGETINGVHRPGAHNFRLPVDPYVVPGDPSSGLLPGITNDAADAPGVFGSSDHRVQAYNFRMFLARMPDAIPFPKPADYDANRYALLLRYIEAGAGPAPPGGDKRFLDFMQLQAGDSNNNGGFSTDNIGMNYGWPEGSYEERERIFQDHVTYQQGFMWFLANDQRVPEHVRSAVRGYGLAKGNFPETGGWPHQLYVREGRRMVSDYVMTQHNCTGKVVAEDSVGLGEYTMDSHNVQRYVHRDRDGKAVVKNEGDVQVRIPGPYPISYRSIVPKESECTNLFVPVCLSATHIAYGSIRMEPVFMVLGQTAGTAASMAIEANVPVQQVSYEKLRRRLIDDRQLLAPPVKPAPPPAGAQLKPAPPHFFRELAAGRRQTVVIYGTSLSHGGAWAEAMKQWFADEYPGLVTVINNSGPGQNSEWGVANLQSKVLDVRPDLVFVEFSYNDAVDRFKLPVEKAAANLATMVHAILGQDSSTAVVLQVMNVGWDAPNGRQSFSVRPELEQYNDNYRAFAQAHGLPLLDHYANWIRLKESDPEKFQTFVPDGSHPSKEGSLAITWPTVKTWLEEARRAAVAGE